jgi:hypothetical protein
MIKYITFVQYWEEMQRALFATATKNIKLTGDGQAT